MDKTTCILTENCRFHLGDEPDAWQAWYDDGTRDWSDVTLPHDWSVRLPFSRDYSSGTGYLAGGIGWYRLRIAPNREWEGKRISLVFDGIYKESRIYCNSYYLGGRPNGYSSFSLDITEPFSFDHENVVAVRVDRSEISDSRWFTGSGITRKVSLVVEEPVHPVYNGIFFCTPAVSDTEASFTVENEIANTTGEEQRVRVSSILLDAEGAYVTAVVAEGLIAAGRTAVLKTEGTVPSPHLWSDADPYLYRLVTTVASLASGRDLSEQTEASVADTRQVGFRSFSFDPQRGFFLNGRHTLLRGVCLHHDAGALGAAVYKCVLRRRLEKLKEMGCNAVRTSHNPHNPELYDLCDELGFLVMDEAFDEWEAPKNKWWQGHNVYPPKNQGYYVHFPLWHERDLTDQIRRDRNHPSVILYSIGNEIDYPNDPYCHPSFRSMSGNNDANKPLKEREYNPLRPNAERLAPLAAELTCIARAADPTRPVTLAAAFPELSADLGFLDTLDVIGFNYKEALYEKTHADFPDKPLLGSETGHRFSDWQAVTANPYIAGQFLWTGIDYLGEAPLWPQHGSSSGLLTCAGFEKPGYYRRKSFWTPAPMLHLTACLYEEIPLEWPEFAPMAESWNFLPGQTVQVRCYTNLNEAEFFLNGRSLGICKKEADADCIVLDVPFEPGTLRAVSADGKTEHSLSTTGTAVQIRLTKWEPSVTPSPEYEEPGEPGASLCQIEAALCDALGNIVRSDSTLLTVSVEGGTLLALDSGDLSDVTDFSAPYRRAYRGQLLLYVLPDAEAEGTAVTVRAENLPAAVLIL